MIADACSFCEPPTWSDGRHTSTTYSPKQPQITMTAQQMGSVIQTQELKDQRLLYGDCVDVVLNVTAYEDDSIKST